MGLKFIRSVSSSFRSFSNYRAVALACSVVSRNGFSRTSVEADLSSRKVDVFEDVGGDSLPQLLVDGVLPGLRRHEREVDHLVENLASGFLEQLVPVQLSKPASPSTFSSIRSSSLKHMQLIICPRNYII